MAARALRIASAGRPWPGAWVLVLWVAALLLLSGTTPAAAATTLEVPAHYPSIQAAIDAAADGDTVRVAAGTYYECLRWSGKSLDLLGAGAGQTVVDAQGAGSCLEVVSVPAGRIEGLTFRGGAGAQGGGLALRSSAVVVTGCVITGNSASSSGGGVYVYASDAVLSGNEISGNSTPGRGGGIAMENDACSPLFSDNTVRDNSAGQDGGVLILNRNQAAPVLRGNTITANTALSGAGGLTVASDTGSSAVVISNTIAGNTAPSFGLQNVGGVHVTNAGGLTTLAGNLITGNLGFTCGALYVATQPGCTTRVVNNTVARNIALGLAGGVFAALPNGTEIANCILWGNLPFDLAGAAATYSDVGFGGMVGAGNLSADPLFVNPDAGDFRLQAGSPCVNAGNNAAPGLPETDRDGSRRIAQGVVDIGAYEWQVSGNQAPVARAGGSRTVEQSGREGTRLALDGSASSDPEGEALTYTWRGPFPEGGGTATGASPIVTLPPGTSVVTLVVNDGTQDSEPDGVSITVVDTTPPAVQAVQATPDTLWPANHKMVDVTLQVQAADAADPAPRGRIVGVACNQTMDATDWQITGDLALRLRATRTGKSGDRVYTLQVECADASGNTAQAFVTVTVPHDQGRVSG